VATTPIPPLCGVAVLSQALGYGSVVPRASRGCFGVFAGLEKAGDVVPPPRGGVPPNVHVRFKIRPSFPRSRGCSVHVRPMAHGTRGRPAPPVRPGGCSATVRNAGDPPPTTRPGGCSEPTIRDQIGAAIVPRSRGCSETAGWTRQGASESSPLLGGCFRRCRLLGGDDTRPPPQLLGGASCSVHYHSGGRRVVSPASGGVPTNRTSGSARWWILPPSRGCSGQGEFTVSNVAPRARGVFLRSDVPRTARRRYPARGGVPCSNTMLARCRGASPPPPAKGGCSAGAVVLDEDLLVVPRSRGCSAMPATASPEYGRYPPRMGGVPT
jgi:hypothetical protein